MLKAWQGVREKEDRYAVIGLVLAMVAAAALLIWVTRGMTLAIDEWYFGYGTRAGSSFADYFAPHNGHLVVFPVLLSKGMLEVFGEGAALPLRLIAIAVHLSTAALLFVWLRRLICPLAALAPAVLFLFLGTANDAFIGSHGMPLTLSAATGIGAWLLLERRRLGADVLAAFLLTVGICCNGYSLPFIVAAFAVVLLDPESSRKRLWVPAVSLVLYGIWYLLEGSSDGQFAIPNIGGLPSFMFDSLAASLATITGLFTAPGVRGVSFDIPQGQALAGACLIALLALVLGWRYKPPKAIVPPLLALLGFWVLTAGVADPARLPNSSRYLYISVLLLLLVLGEMIAASRIRREGAIALAAICLFALLPNLREVVYASNSIREQSTINRAVLGAADMVGDHAPGDLNIESPNDPPSADYPDLQFTFDQYATARDRFGTPAFTLAQIQGSIPTARVAADHLIARALPITVDPLPGPRRSLPATTEVVPLDAVPLDGVLRREDGCLRFVPLAVTAQLTLQLPVGGLWVRPEPGTPVPIAVKRFAVSYETPAGAAFSGRATAVTLPPAGQASRHWRAQLTPQQPILICGASPRG